MKKIFSLFLLTGLLLTSCSDFLDLTPQGQENSGNYMNTEENAIKVINGIYDILSQTEGRGPDGDWMDHHYDFMLASIATDDAVKGSNLPDMPQLIDLEDYRLQQGSSLATAFWIHGFWGVSRSNYAIKNLPDATIPENLKNRLLGESYFLRAYHYIYLLRHFGGVPLFSAPLNPSDFGKTVRATLHETFEFINADLRQAIELLPERSTYPAADMGRATKGAARAFLAKSLMYQIGVDAECEHTWNDVYNLTLAIINSGEYSLVPNFALLFEYENKNSSESIFEIQAADGTASDAPASVGNAYPLFQGNRESNTGANTGWGFHNPTQNLVDAFNPSDPRLSSTVYGIGFNNEILYGVQMKFNRTEQGSNYLNRKAALPFKPSLDKAANKNILIMRYADVLLIHAEAAYHTGKEVEARQYLNMVRERARNSSYCKGYVSGSPDGYTMPVTTPDVPNVNVSGTALLDAILHERRLELAMESNRMWDLVRTGKLVDTVSKAKDTDLIGNEGRTDMEVRHEGIANRIRNHAFTGKDNTVIPVLPIPLDEVQNWGLEQNPNY
ncbi:RagB/SusD family nutrient uptake outer membrane protein [Proteiniphilum sp. UBA5384]|uniref:RagB/SusD family nutrient uptake outer membrane protein n=1 Tax=Proteiniphilum sp. UBA5384 TaxID=1947279 RepID=UPI0025FC7FAB|nr:RagB/SusD family nutrient uptake outer membrane protein [Proteiniphilum sp. UBA5384]